MMCFLARLGATPPTVSLFLKVAPPLWIAALARCVSAALLNLFNLPAFNFSACQQPMREKLRYDNSTLSTFSMSVANA